MTTASLAEQADRVRREIAARSGPAVEWMRTALVHGVPLGALLLDADAANIASPPMPGSAGDWDAASAKAEAMVGATWRLGETHEIAIRHLWGLWVPHDMHEWRVFRNSRAAEQVEADYFRPVPLSTQLP